MTGFRVTVYSRPSSTWRILTFKTVVVQTFAHVLINSACCGLDLV